MPVPAPDDVTERAGQLVLDEEVFSSLGTLATYEVITLRDFYVAKLPEKYQTLHAYTAMGSHLGALRSSLDFWIGDLLVEAETRFGEDFSQMSADTGLAPQTILNKTLVSRNVPPKNRKATLSWSVHYLVARLSPKEQKQWLDQAEKGGWSSAELAERMKAKRRDEKPQLFDDPPTPLPNSELIVEVAHAILRDAKEAGDDQNFLVPVEDITRLRAALGQEG
jgi:hypothetical protein